jgi:LDH2 family malate/lactate/ureidoglycolate dehydrogenase
MEQPQGTVWVQFDLLERFMIDVFKGIGVPESEAAICADTLINADKRGVDSHGVGRLKTIYYDRIKAGIQFAQTKIDVIKEGPTTALLDANHGMGMVASHKAMQMAIDKAKQYGTGMVVVRNSTHYGFCAQYLLQAVNQGCIGITGTNARPSIVPTFGAEGMMGTNPLTFGIPTDEDFPFVLDCATSVSQRGKVEMAARAEQPIPEGWVVGTDGKYRTDTVQILHDLVHGGAGFVPLGGAGEEQAGYKGYGFAVVVEMLSAALQDGAFMKDLNGLDENGKKTFYKLGHFFIAIDVEHFLKLERFKQVAGNICRALRASEKATGAERIYTAGEKEWIAWLDRKDKGAPVNPNLQKEMLIMRDELGLTQYKFPFEK